MRNRCTTFILATAAVIAGCSDLATETEVQRQNAVPITQAATTVLPVDQRFSVSLRAIGAFTPGQPIQVTATITANLATDDADIRFVFPEVETAKRSGWNSQFRYGVGEQLPAARQQRHALTQGAQITESVTVTIPVEGWFRVTVRVSAGPEAPLQTNGRWIQNTVVAEQWLLIKTAGGGVRDSLSTQDTPSEFRTVPGPFRPARQPERANTPGLQPQGANNSALNSAFSFITYQVLYWDTDLQAYAPVPTAYYAIRGCTKNPEQIICDPEDFEQIDSGYTDSSGYLSFACQGDEYEGDTSTYTAAAMRVNGGVAAIGGGDVSSDCGQTFSTVIPSNPAKVFINTMAARSGASTLFGTTRSWIEIHLASSSGSYYSSNNDEITIDVAHVWGIFGIFAAAHEYGHAFHNDALYGNVASGNCPDPHFLDTESNLQCAYSEGFANYFGAAVRADLGSYSYRNYMENNDAFPGCVSRQSTSPYNCTGGVSTEGSLIEGAFAAILYDLTDSVIEPHDSIAAPGSYLRELIRTCQVYYSNWRRANGTDEVVYCAENSINPGSYLTPRGSTPTAYSESASESGGWTSGRVNANWRYNMYEKQ